MTKVLIAVLADIHGNLAALKAVLADLQPRQPGLIVNLGDCVSGPLEAGRTASELMRLGWPTVRGNHDRYVVAPGGGGLSDSHARSELSPEQLGWLATLPATISLLEGRLLACHGTPASDEEYLAERVVGGEMVLAEAAQIAGRLGDTGKAEVILHGHSHLPRWLWLADGRLLLNPGSVGCPAYLDHDHRMQTGSPDARYALLKVPQRQGEEWQAEFVTVGYDWQAAAELAARRGRADWAEALATGRVTPA
jgi:predicted phosphodiesterase